MEYMENIKLNTIAQGKNSAYDGIVIKCNRNNGKRKHLVVG
jgi:hypothetical protein